MQGYESGVTSIKRTSLIESLSSPCKIPAWTAAPKATASSGFTPLFGSFPLKKSLTLRKYPDNF